MKVQTIPVPALFSKGSIHTAWSCWVLPCPQHSEGAGEKTHAGLPARILLSNIIKLQALRIKWPHAEHIYSWWEIGWFVLSILHLPFFYRPYEVIESWFGRENTNHQQFSSWPLRNEDGSSYFPLYQANMASEPIPTRSRIFSAFYIHTAPCKVIQWRSEHGTKLPEERPNSRSKMGCSERFGFSKPPPLPRTLSCHAQPWLRSHW